MPTAKPMNAGPGVAAAAVSGNKGPAVQPQSPSHGLNGKDAPAGYSLPTMAGEPASGARPNGYALAGAPVTVGHHSTLPAEASASRQDKPIPATEPMAPLQKPAVLAEKARPPRTNGAADVAPAVAPGGVRTLEDTVVDLLRPMLRQWLDENMPRMVEKALRIELAQSVKPNAEPPKH